MNKESVDTQSAKDKVAQSNRNRKVIYYHSTNEYGDGTARAVYRQTWEIYGTDEAQ
jgi:hypothetical protein